MSNIESTIKYIKIKYPNSKDIIGQTLILNTNLTMNDMIGIRQFTLSKGIDIQFENVKDKCYLTFGLNEQIISTKN